MKKLFLFLSLFFSVGLMAKTTYYVSPSGDVANDGTSWTKAKKLLSEVLAIPTIADGDEILVAQGEYTDIQLRPKNTLTIKGGYDPLSGMQNLKSPSVLTKPAESTGALIWFEEKNDWPLNGKVLTLDNLEIKNSISSRGAGVHVAYKTVQTNNVFTMTNCRFTGNKATGDLGGAVFADKIDVKIMNCIFSDNSAEIAGAALWIRDGKVEIKNSLFCKNISSETKGTGGAVQYKGSSCIVTNCTFVANNAGGTQGKGGALKLETSGPSNAPAENPNSFVEINNSIFWGNMAQAHSKQICIAHTPVEVTFTKCLIQDGVVKKNPTDTYAPIHTFAIIKYGSGLEIDILEEDPLFVDADNGDYRLKSKSPAINEGDNNKAAGLTFDLGRRERIYNKTIDLGAYEYNPSTETSLVTLAPNLTYDRINASIQLSELPVDNKTLQIFDLNGSLLASITIDSKRIDVSFLPVGLYLVKLGQGAAVGKIIR